jgi:hypothetical protein
MAAAAAAYPRRLRRIVTPSFGADHWITLGEPDPDTTHRPVILTTNAHDAAWATFYDFGSTPHTISLSLPDQESLFLQPRTDPATGVGLVAHNDTEGALWTRTTLASGILGPPQYWIRPAGVPDLFVTAPPDGRTLHLAADAILFMTETLCECGDCWTRDPSGECMFCRGQAMREEEVEEVEEDEEAAAYAAAAEEEEDRHNDQQDCAYCGNYTRYTYCSRSCAERDRGDRD